MNIELEMQTVISQLNTWNKAYEIGKPIVNDKTYDDLYFYLLQLEEESGIKLKNSPTCHIIYNIVDNLAKVKHNHPMLSLAKTKEIEELKKFIGSKSVILMDKMDGLTCSLRYLDGKLVSAETRGNGEFGDDILHNANVIKNIPKRITFKGELIIDGEVICDYDTFSKWKEIYSHPRNMASGVLKLLDSHESAKFDLSFVAWDVVKGFDDLTTLSSKLDRLSDYRFECVPYLTNEGVDFNLEKTIESLKLSATAYAYPIDGIVAKYDDVKYYYSLGHSAHDFAGGLAFKFYDEEYETKLINIEWQVGRTSILSPIAVFAPVDLDGAITEKASLSNLDIIQNYLGKPYIGQRIKVARMNMVIPKVTWGDKETPKYPVTYLDYPKVCPCCGNETKVISSESGTNNLYCTNELCNGKLITKLDYFAGKSGLDIKGLSQATIADLIKWGWVKTFVDLYDLEKYQKIWIRKPGYSVTSVKKLLTAINNSKTCELWRFISALGIPMVGPNISKEICKKESIWLDFQNDINNHFDFRTWNGFGEEINNAINNFNYEEANKLSKMFNFVNSLYIKEEKIDGKLKDLIFVITGSVELYSNREELKEKIESFGGKVVGSVSKKTNYLINNDVNSSSSKNIKAKELGVKIITENEFNKIIE